MKPALAKAISNAIAQIGASAASLTTASRAEALYEGFVFACVIEALKDLGGTFEVRDHDDKPTPKIVFRTKPTLIYSKGSTFVHVRLGGEEYEVHTNVRVLGRSSVLHELDVAIIDHSEGARCRAGTLLPRGAKVRFLAECKFYGRSLPLHLGREFLGLSSEFSLRVKTIVSSVGNNSIHEMITAHRGTENFDVSPLQPNNTKRFVAWLAKELSQVLM